MNKTIRGFEEFIKAALRDPRNVSTIFPTLRFLGQALVDEAQIQADHTIVELGCGSGAITQHILNPQVKFHKFTGVEIDPHLVDFLKKTHPNHNFIATSAADLKDHINDNSVDAVISSLPWTMFPGELQKAIIDEIHRILKPNGRLSTFMCIHALAYPGALRAQNFLEQKFSNFEKKRTIVMNLPPANVYLAKK